MRIPFLLARETYQGPLVPCYSFVLVRVRVRKALDLTSFAPEQSMKIGSDLVAFRFFQVVTLGASSLR